MAGLRCEQQRLTGSDSDAAGNPGLTPGRLAVLGEFGHKLATERGEIPP
jgi:hypothetical protein